MPIPDPESESMPPFRFPIAPVATLRAAVCPPQPQQDKTRVLRMAPELRRGKLLQSLLDLDVLFEMFDDPVPC